MRTSFAYTTLFIPCVEPIPWGATMLMMFSRAGVRRCVVAGAATVAVTATSRATYLEEVKDDEPKPPPCLRLHLVSSSSDAVVDRFPPTHAKVLAERVLLRPCVTEKLDSVPMYALAYVEEGKTQSLLVRPGGRLWQGSPESYGGVGYPVLPISMKDMETTLPPPPPPVSADTAAQAVADGTAAGEEAIEEGLTLWEEVEEPWRLLEAAGVLVVQRGEDAIPTGVKLASGGTEWHGNVAVSDGSTRRMGVTILNGPEGWPLAAKSAEAECGFCRFMKDGPCGEVFQLWEDCIDRAKESSKDFVEMCGAETLKLKKCTDEHPDYYGELSGGGEENKDEEK